MQEARNEVKTRDANQLENTACVFIFLECSIFTNVIMQFSNKNTLNCSAASLSPGHGVVV